MLKIAVKNLQKRIPVSPQQVKKLIRRILKEEGVRCGGEITVSIVTDHLIRRINLAYSDKDMTTDVLAFNTSESFDNGGLFADIIVSSDTAFRNSKTYSTPALNELKLYIAHGLLHLLGYNHSTSSGSRIMRDKEKKYANK